MKSGKHCVPRRKNWVLKDPSITSNKLGMAFIVEGVRCLKAALNAAWKLIHIGQEIIIHQQISAIFMGQQVFVVLPSISIGSIEDFLPW